MYHSSAPDRHKQPISLTSLGAGLRWIASTLLSLPLFLLPRRGRPVRIKAIHEMHPLAYLDGLRGYAALTVFTCHVLYKSWKWIPNWVIATPWLQWPFRQGHASVLLFFWASGYVSTYKIAGLMQSGQSQQLLDNLASISFRRYLRLFLPLVPVMFVTTMLVSAGIAIMPSSIASDKPNATVISNPFWYWIQDVGRFMDPFTKIVGYSDGGTGSKLLEHTWSLPAQFRATMILCLFCIATHKLSTRNRKILTGVAILASLYWAASWAAVSWLGMWFAECRQEQQAQIRDKRRSLSAEPSALTDKTPSLEDGVLLNKQENTQPRIKYFERCREWTLLILFLYSFVYMQYPQSITTKTTFPHRYVNGALPGHWHIAAKTHIHLVIGCTMMVYPLDQLRVLQRPLLSSFSQFLGELSFGIYAVHYTIRWIVWEPIWIPYVARRCGYHGMDYFWCVFPGYFGMAVCVLWAAEGFRRIDMQVVRLSRVLEDKLFEK